MTEPLRPLLLLLVLTNIGFVYLTGSMGPMQTVLLGGLTLAAPWLHRLQGRAGYQLLWNGSVVVIFTLLLQHALSTGLLHMLEDGLLLAALCQVHLLNNLGPKQRPDLLFFNSFLIAFITSFFSQDVSWSVAFFCYVVTLVPALQLYIALPPRRPAAPALVRAVVRDGLRNTAVALAVTALVFAFWPRDFRRQGWLQDHLDLSRLTGMEAGFSEELRLDRAGVASTSERVVLRIAPQHGEPGEVPSHWRGATLTDFDGTTWTADPIDHQLNAHRADEPWQRRGNTWSRHQPGVGGVLQVRVLDSEVDRVFLPPAATEFELSPRLAVGIETRADGTVAWTRELGRGRRSLPPGYQVRCGASDRQRAPAIGDLARRRLLQLGPLELPPPLLALARDLHQRLPRGAGPAEITESVRRWLSENRRYALPGSPDAAHGLHEFLLGHGGGHCELFAATLALLLRVQGIPCRIVTGYLASEWNAAAGEIVVRRRDAHAWVEVLLADQGWITCDATPPAEQRSSDPSAATTWWSAIERRAQSLWAAVTGFDADKRAQVLTFLLQLPRALWAGLRGNAWAAGAALLLLGWWLRRRRRPRERTVRELCSAVRRCGLRLLPGETPRELLRRASAAHQLGVRRFERLTAAAAAHERRRYGIRPEVGR